MLQLGDQRMIWRMGPKSHQNKNRLQWGDQRMLRRMGEKSRRGTVLMDLMSIHTAIR